jgi:manganese oxidase
VSRPQVHPARRPRRRRRRRSLAILAAVLALCGCDAGPRDAPDSVAVGDRLLTVATTHDNRQPAGALRDGVLELRLVARPAAWRPEADDGPALAIEAFAEESGLPLVPGPLIRAPAGTLVHATVRNAVAETLLVVGLSERGGNAPDSLRLLPGETREVRFTLREPGTFLYRAFSVHGQWRRNGGSGGQLVGAMLVDPAVGAAASAVPPADRVFVLSAWNADPDSITGRFVMAINGKSWPHTERLEHAIGDSAHWRLVNATASEHPMHLHGFHFRVDSRGGGWTDSLLPGPERPMVVTEFLRPGGTASLTWVPERAGRWLFHCHVVSHVSGDRHFDLAGAPPPGPQAEHAREMTIEEAMAGLVLGIEVAGDPAAGLGAGPPSRHERLVVTERAGVYGGDPGYGFVLQDDVEPAPDSVVIPGSPIVLTRGEPTEITVVNRSSVATAVHWHGLELESYYDGVPGWSGDARRTAPHVVPGDSFTVRLAPPRAGTFIYHTHAKHVVQLTSGLYGPLIVLEPGETRDPATDHVLLFSVGGPTDTSFVVLNGGAEPALGPLEAGRSHRLRFINITAEDEIGVALFHGTEPLTGRLLAKDAGPAPIGSAAGPEPVRFAFGPGETYDFEIAAPHGAIRIEVTSYTDFEARIPVRAGARTAAGGHPEPESEWQ